MAVINTDFTNNVLSLVDDLVTADMVDMSKSIYERQFETNGISETHTVIPGVRHGSVVPILRDIPNPDSFPFVDATSCDVTECDLPINSDAVKWSLGLIECRVPICLRSFDENFLLFWNTYRHACQGEPDMDSAMMKYLMNRFEKNLQLSTWRAAYFGDTNSASAYYDGIDGFFVQAEAGDGIKIEITENSESTYTDQIAELTPQDAFDYLVQMYNSATSLAWFDPSLMEFRVTRTIGSKLVQHLNTLGITGVECACVDPAKASQGVSYNLGNIMLFGIPVRVHGEWDDIINYSTVLNGGGGDNARTDPHRAILTYRENLLIGTNQTECLESLDIWYSKETRNIYLDGSSYLGAQIPLSDYVYAGGPVGT